MIAAALARAAYDRKVVLVQFGNNECEWCVKLYDLFRTNQEISKILQDEYEVVLVDVDSNRALLDGYDPGVTHSYPWLTLLNSSGEVICNQDTESFVMGSLHNPTTMRDFLVDWQSERIDAGQALAAGLKRAAAEKKRLFVHFGASWCGPCNRLEAFLRNQKELFEIDYIDLKIDVDRMAHAEESRLRLRPRSGGIPWIAILDAKGKPLATSDGPDGNIGYPSTPQGIEHFISMLNRTRKRLSDDQLGELKRQIQKDAADRGTVPQRL